MTGFSVHCILTDGSEHLDSRLLMDQSREKVMYLRDGLRPASDVVSIMGLFGHALHRMMQGTLHFKPVNGLPLH